MVPADESVDSQLRRWLAAYPSHPLVELKPSTLIIGWLWLEYFESSQPRFLPTQLKVQTTIGKLALMNPHAENVERFVLGVVRFEKLLHAIMTK